MKNSKRIIDSFRLRDTLNPKVWDNYSNTENSKLKKIIKDRLSKIADEFIENLGDDIFVDDIVLMGSLVNYNWSQYSDFDLHVLIDFGQFGNMAEIKKENFELKKDSFNKKHNIKIYGYDVELYAQDANEKHYSSGVYSILTDEWVSFPKKEKFTLDIELLKKKIKCWVSKINSLTKDEKNLDFKRLKSLKDKLKTYRKAGLEKKGELSYENLVFKYLRRSGDIGKLLDSKNLAYDKSLSIENFLKEQTESDTQSTLIKTIDDLMETSEIQFLKNLYKDDLVFDELMDQKNEKTKENIKKLQSLFKKVDSDFVGKTIDGVFDKKMTDSVKKFQSENNLPITGKVGENEFKKLTALLVLIGLKNKYSTDSLLSKNSKGNTKLKKVKGFTYVDINSPEGYKIYKEICDNFINARNPNVGITGKMLADSAKKYSSQGYVPPELALAQLAAEGGLSKNPKAKPIVTKNPYNVGNTDSGKIVPHSTFESGIDSYYNLMTKRYLVGGKKAEDLLDNFVNVKGHQYASGNKYEGLLKDIIKGMDKYTEPVISKYTV